MQASRPAQAAAPLTTRLPAARLPLVRAITAAVVVGPAIGSLILLAFWIGQGVRAESLWALAIAYVLGTLGVTIGFHRYFAHKSFETSRPVRLALVVFGSMSAQGSLLYWVATHRRHHQCSDTPDDPHSPHFRGATALSGWRGFWHGHIGWMFAAEHSNAIRYAPDILRDRAVFELQRRYGLWVTIGLALPVAIGAVFTRDPITLVQIFLAAGPLRLFLVHHASWAVGSISHLYGRRPFRVSDRSTNNFWVALVAFGEGLQNNHHAFPRSAIHSFHWSEPDLTGLVLRLLAALGVIRDLHRPSEEAIFARRADRVGPSKLARGDED